MRTQVNWIREVTLNYKNKPKESLKFVGESTHVAEFLRDVLPCNTKEHFLAVYLSGGHDVIAWSVVCTGIANSCNIHPREVFQPASAVGAVAVVIAHNHPSNSPKPSTEDLQITERMKEVGALVGIKLLDSMVITENGYYSYADEGRI